MDLFLLFSENIRNSKQEAKYLAIPEGNPSKNI